MGNSHPRNNKIKIYIETQKPFFNSGSTIQGVVFIDCQQNFTFDALYIRIQGDQWCQWFEGSSLNRRKFTGNQNFYAVQHILEKYPDKTLQAGSYAYPFSIQLSQNIPGSFSCKYYDAKIAYKLGAYFVNYSSPEQTQIQYIPLIIRQPFRQEIVPYQGTVQRTPKTCFCISHGIIILHAWFERNVAYEGEQVKIQIIGDNRKGNSDINQFLIQLVQYTFVSSNNGVCQTYSKTVKSQTHVQYIKMSDKKTFQLDFKIPEVQHQTAISTLVANYYRLQVSTKSSKIASSQPCIYAPIFILKRTFEGVQDEPKQIKSMNTNMSKYKVNKALFFRAPQYWFKKNKNLSVMNFKLQDHFGVSNQNNF